IVGIGTGSTADTLTVDDPGTVYIPSSVTFTSHVTPAPDPNGWQPGWVNFSIDGQNGFQYNGTDPDGNQTLTITTAGWHPGQHSVSASYTGSQGPDYLRPADSTVVQFTVGIGTTVTLMSGLNPSLSTQPVPLTAVVTSATGDPLDGGTLTITDAF